MSDALEQYRQEYEEMQLAAMIWWLILWYASDEGKRELPLESEWLSCELVATLMEEVTGEKFRYSWKHDNWGHERIQEWVQWPQYLNAQVDKCHAQHRNAFNDASIEGRLRELLRRFVRYSFQTDHDQKDWLSELRHFCENNISRSMRQRTFIPQKEMTEKSFALLAEQGIKFFAAAMPWCRKMGAIIMRSYLSRDIAYIKRHYTG